MRDLPDGHTDFFREHADGGDEAAGHAGPRPSAVGGHHIAELTELIHGVKAGHTCGKIQVIRDDVSEGLQCLSCRSTSEPECQHMSALHLLDIYKGLNLGSCREFPDVILGCR